MPVIRRHIADDVQSDGEFQVARIEIHQMIRPLRRDVVQQFLGQVAVRVNDANAVSKGDVLQDQVPQQRRFAGAGFADDVDVLALVHGGNAKGLGFAPAMTFADCDVLVVHGARTSRHPCHRSKPGCGGFRRWFAAGSSAGARRRDNGGWFWNPNGPPSYHPLRKMDAPVGAAEIKKRPVGRCFLPASVQKVVS